MAGTGRNNAIRAPCCPFVTVLLFSFCHLSLLIHISLFVNSATQPVEAKVQWSEQDLNHAISGTRPQGERHMGSHRRDTNFTTAPVCIDDDGSGAGGQ